MLPPNPRTRSGVQLPNQGINVVPGTPRSRIRLGLLPVRDPGAPQPANIITLPNHPLWEVSSGEEMYQYLEVCFAVSWQLVGVNQEGAVVGCER